MKNMNFFFFIKKQSFFKQLYLSIENFIIYVLMSEIFFSVNIQLETITNIYLYIL